MRRSSKLRFWQILTITVFLILVGAGLAPLAGANVPVAQAAGFIDAKLDPALVAELNRVSLNTPLEVVIVFDDMAASAQVAALATAYYQMQALPMAGAALTKQHIQQIADWPQIYSITLNTTLDYFLAESAPYIGADEVWSQYGETGSDVTVAVIDSGIDATHLDLLFGEKVIQNVKVPPLGPGLENVPITDTSSGHGTHVAGTIGGTGTISDGYYRGVAPGVKLVGLGAGEVIAVLTAVQSYDWVLQNHAQYNIRVVSNSWGSSGGELNVRNPIVMATYEGYKRGILSVFAAGNDGGYDILNPYSLAPWVLSVAAGDKSGRLADFSSRGKDGDFYKHPDITAPGVNIYAARSSTLGVTVLDPYPNPVNPAWTLHYTRMSGTSMATPHVSGAAALLLSNNLQLSPDEVIHLLTSTARPMAGYAWHEVGYGYLDALAAYEASINVSGNLAAFLNGQRQYSMEEVLGFDPDTLQYDVKSYTGFTAVGVTGMPANTYPVAVNEEVVYVEARLEWEPQEEDAYDLEVYDPEGRLVTSSGNFVNEAESVLFIPEMTGTYSIHVVPFAAVASQYSLTVTTAYGGRLGGPPQAEPVYDYYLGVAGVYKTHGALGLRTNYFRGGDQGFIVFSLSQGNGTAVPGQAANLQVVYSNHRGEVVFVDNAISDRGAGEYQSSFTLNNSWAGSAGPVTVNFAWKGAETMRALPTGFNFNHLDVALQTSAANYNPGATISFNGDAKQVSTLGTGEVILAPVTGAPVTISLRDAAGNTLASTQAQTNLQGRYSGSLVAPASTRGLVTLVAEATYSDATMLTGPNNWYGEKAASLRFPGNLAPEVSLYATPETSNKNKHFIHIHAVVSDPDGRNDISSITLTLVDGRGRVLKTWRQNQFTPVEESWMLTTSHRVTGSAPWTLTLTAVDKAGNTAGASVEITSGD